jgi:predicted TPR repeat methyltransferase
VASKFSASGDLLADRRFVYAEALLADGDTVAAADLLGQTLERVPDWAPAWMALADAEERQGRLEAALTAYARAEALDSKGALGAALHLARLRGETIPADRTNAYVAALFDDYAPRFERHLIEALGYHGPALLVEALDAACGERRFASALDLGCGTGLMGAAIRSRVEAVDGIDLSPAMVERAAATGHYRSVRVEGIDACLAGLGAASTDLILAADVFVYVGPLDRVMAEAARVLTSRGILAFTVEECFESDLRLGSKLRYAHSRAYLTGVLDRAGFSLAVLREASSRREGGEAAPGLVVAARKE